MLYTVQRWYHTEGQAGYGVEGRYASTEFSPPRPMLGCHVAMVLFAWVGAGAERASFEHGLLRA